MENENPDQAEQSSDPIDVSPEKDSADSVQDHSGKVTEKKTYEQIESELKKSLEKSDENWAQFLNAKAEAENLKKRHIREQENARKYALERFSQELLQVKDSLELGLTAANADDAEVSKLIEGSELTLKLLTSVLEKFDIEEVNPKDEKFNPDHHQAMSMLDRDDLDANTVIQVIQKGYLLNGRLLRPAMVIVSKKPAVVELVAEPENDEPN
ncbi:MAG: nucleotide exchange factor GrpE [Methylococcales bacterium]|jgi:molecular chaperone GrpE|nr:nucleotide exchange factor GrpE [Methylococcales bacterium]MBT7409181.1 nucleotide exchange factor GrpE [Methylococcales bacterium]